MRRARPSTGRWRRCGNTGRSMLYMSRAAGNSRRPGLYFSGSCAMLGPRNKREARLRRREPAANRGRSRRLTRIRFAPPKRRSGISAHLRCAGGYRRAVRHTAGFVPNREGRGGHGNRLSRGPLPGPGPGASPTHPVCRQQPDSSPLPPGGGSQAGRRSAGAPGAGPCAQGHPAAHRPGAALGHVRVAPCHRLPIRRGGGGEYPAVCGAAPSC